MVMLFVLASLLSSLTTIIIFLSMPLGNISSTSPAKLTPKMLVPTIREFLFTVKLAACTGVYLTASEPPPPPVLLGCTVMNLPHVPSGFLNLISPLRTSCSGAAPVRPGSLGSCTCTVSVMVVLTPSLPGKPRFLQLFA